METVPFSYVGRFDVDGDMRVYGREIIFAGRAACPASPLVHRGIATGSGLRLGLSRIQAAATLGERAIAGDRVIWTSCQASRLLTSEEKVAKDVPSDIVQLDVSATFDALMVTNKVVGFEIRWTETY